MVIESLYHVLSQSLQEPDKIQECIAVAERGLSDLESFVGAHKKPNFDLHLKGATT